MANSVMMYECLGRSKHDADLLTAKSALRKLLVLAPGRSYCQPCLSPVWDTGLAAHALLEAGGDQKSPARRKFANEKFEDRRLGLAMVQIGLDHVELVKVREQRAGQQVHLTTRPRSAGNGLRLGRMAS